MQKQASSETSHYVIECLGCGRDLTKGEQIHFLSSCCSDCLPLFQTLSLFSRLFPGLENCFANFKTFSRIQDCMNLVKLTVDTHTFSRWIISNPNLKQTFLKCPPPPPSPGLRTFALWTLHC